MKLDKIKQHMKSWRDFYGQDITDIEAIQKAKTKQEAKVILKEHKRWLQDQNQDAIIHIDEFIKLLGLDKIE